MCDEDDIASSPSAIHSYHDVWEGAPGHQQRHEARLVHREELDAPQPHVGPGSLTNLKEERDVGNKCDEDKSVHFVWEG